ncbi:hypothetical protein FA09DRAFT_218928 [Tilletiopsis washingtonensis]|uniref:Uncharacterized protein n=1 Tax=Tilletiopsis washingtonensis TaxID=58919 RepID=A0A316ZFI6_9BASI|nr:hypothetical protein FA09DRAFT_218928 [Tilletiopsis washingtonensis]PWN99788.1 hypothetical protein FA09DRAFT_218928 [Tilletiopsis washingtonensis]
MPRPTHAPATGRGAALLQGSPRACRWRGEARSATAARRRSLMSRAMRSSLDCLWSAGHRTMGCLGTARESTEGAAAAARLSAAACWAQGVTDSSCLTLTAVLRYARCHVPDVLDF